MSKKTGKILLGVLGGLLFFTTGVFPAPGDPADGGEEMTRGAIPEALLRPQRGESPRYPVDTVIGSLGRGEAPGDAYRFAREVAAALITGNLNAPALGAMNRVSLEAFMAALNTISPRTYRLGSGREEPDGAVSFLVRFLGRERGIAGELYVRPAGDGALLPDEEPLPEAETAPEDAGENGQAGETEAAGDTEAVGAVEEAGATEAAGADEGADPAAGVSPEPAVWQFEDLILEEARERGVEADHRFEFPPYERFF